ncbi:MAG: SUMF1/EgtB/PvdO family nonheme iron enzyme [Akkermansiaceae bacterium]|nr:SUMF1/EgtB/PvdO family nonheme iron enzyme [Akkermansiaceae bacterium]
MPSKSRPDPVIPDHEILRKIGGGAYGEVWLGRGVTGALRAVKVVWREDFEDARGFEREFEGILKFEPMSRDHPGLVHILHVGRSPDGVSFYYYVMELGDDVRSGQNINPIEYEPRTLRADAKQALHPQLDTDTCIDVGLRLAEALHHLHERGLAHRDVKPSNVIFLNGKAKLADIGLVAARDQRTFVGTEGFVPPEGPGSAQADVYSLGKVLYEIATGKDRLEFPELPDTLPNGSQRKRWLELNKIICDICEPRLSKRMITSAAELAEALRRLQRGKRARRKRSFSLVWVVSLLLLGLAGWAGYEVTKRGRIQTLVDIVRPPPVKRPVEKFRQVKLITIPGNATVYDGKGTYVDLTPTREINAKLGQTLEFRIELAKYQPKDIKVTVVDGDGVMAVIENLQPDQPPEGGVVWMDHLRNRYKPLDSRKSHISEGYMKKRDWLMFNAASARKTEDFLTVSQNGIETEITLANDEAARAFCSWLEGEALRNGLLTRDFEMVPDRDLSFKDPKMTDAQRKEDLRPFYVVVRRIDFGMVRLKTDPPEVEVFIDGMRRGMTDKDGALLLERVKPGSHIKFTLLKEGFKPLEFDTEVVPSQTGEITRKLEENKGIIFGRDWKNTLGMEFVPLGPDLMVSKWESRVADYRAFITGYNADLTRQQEAAGPEAADDIAGALMPLTMPLATDFSQADDHPVVYVSRDDAEKFCIWLTRKEREEGLIRESHVYRLPTDLEWSRMAAIEDQPGKSPLARDSDKQPRFPWGTAWPPPKGAGNFADTSAALAPGKSSDLSIPGYSDDNPYTSTVGSYPANRYGIFDLSGNAQEWVYTDWKDAEDIPVMSADGRPIRAATVDIQMGVLRGGGWDTYREEALYTGFRNWIPPSKGDASTGFRVVLVRVGNGKEINPLDPVSPAPVPPVVPGAAVPPLPAPVPAPPAPDN